MRKRIKAKIQRTSHDLLVPSIIKYPLCRSVPGVSWLFNSFSAFPALTGIPADVFLRIINCLDIRSLHVLNRVSTEISGFNDLRQIITVDRAPKVLEIDDKKVADRCVAAVSAMIKDGKKCKLVNDVADYMKETRDRRKSDSSNLTIVNLSFAGMFFVLVVVMITPKFGITGDRVILPAYGILIALMTALLAQLCCCDRSDEIEEREVKRHQIRRSWLRAAPAAPAPPAFVLVPAPAFAP